MNYLEIGATIFGLIQGLLIMFNKRSNWIAYVIQMIFMTMFSLYSGLYGDAVNSICYIFIGIIGFLIWNKKGEKNISVCSWKERMIYITTMILTTFFLYLILNKTNDPLPLIDAFTTTSSFIATYYMIVKKIDTWIIWFINDIFYCITYWLLPEQAFYLLALNIIWTFMAVGSFINWYKIKKVKKLYCAGTFCFDFLESDYKTKAKEDYRSHLLGSEEKLLQKSDHIKLNSNWLYIGPFYFETEGMIDELIVKTEIEMIKKCSHAIFLLDSGRCAGTIAELILAANLKKDISVFYVKKPDNEETESKLHSPCWFPIIMSKLNNKKTKIFSCTSYKDATEKIIKYVKQDI